MKTITRNFYSDGGHGWLKVKFSELLKLNIQDKISAYSYMRNGDVFLEEDGDLTTYCSALKEINTEIKIYKIDDNIPISKDCLELISNMLCRCPHNINFDYIIDIITLEKNKEIEKLALIKTIKEKETEKIQLIKTIEEIELKNLYLIETNKNLEKNNLLLFEVIHDKKQMIKLKQKI